jgi:hypothetical protein
MLSTEVRKKAEFICSRIAEKAEVPVSDMIWIQKWAKSNHSVESMLRRARRRAMRGDQPAEAPGYGPEIPQSRVGDVTERVLPGYKDRRDALRMRLMNAGILPRV